MNIPKPPALRLKAPSSNLANIVAKHILLTQKSAKKIGQIPAIAKFLPQAAKGI